MTRGTAVGTRRGRAPLLVVLGLYLGGEMILGPFYPQLFRELYGVQDLTATGTYLVACRLAGVLALPVWGLAARRFSLHRLVVTGLLVAAVPNAALGLAPDHRTFTLIAMAAAATEVSMLLAYPALVALDDADGADRLRGVRGYAAIFHVSTVVATFGGAAVLALPSPRIGIASLAVLMVLLAWLCHRLLAPGTPAKAVCATRTSKAASRPGPTGRSRTPLLALLAIAGLAAAFEIATAIVRPFFVEYVAGAGASQVLAATLFALANVAALVVLPAAGLCLRALGGWLLPAAFVLAAAGLVTQAASTSLPVLAAGRLLFGFGLGLGHVAVDLRMFAATGTLGPAYTVVESARFGALFAAPVLATAAAERAVTLPLVAGSLAFVTAAAFTLPRTASTSAPSSSVTSQLPDKEAT